MEKKTGVNSMASRCAVESVTKNEEPWNRTGFHEIRSDETRRASSAENDRGLRFTEGCKAARLQFCFFVRLLLRDFVRKCVRELKAVREDETVAVLEGVTPDLVVERRISRASSFHSAALGARAEGVVAQLRPLITRARSSSEL